MNIWLISDTHFGLKNNSKVWEEHFRECFDKFVFPLFEKKARKGDILIHCGDVFDNRQTVGLTTLAFTMDIFEKLGRMFSQVYVLCGNHDAYEKDSNDITSIDCLKHIPNISVIKEPKSIAMPNGKVVGFVPWINDNGLLSETLCGMDDCDIVVCHADFNGVTMNASGTKSESQLHLDDTRLDCRIYSGHIHHRQTYKNVVYVGSPYQMSQNDRDNDRGVMCVKENGDEEFYRNGVSAEFKRVDYEEVKDLPLREFKEFCKRKYIDICVDSDLLSKLSFHKIYGYINNNSDIYNINFVPKKSSLTIDVPKVSMSECVSIEDMLDKYVDNVLEYDDKVKSNIKKIAKKLINGQ
jgi:DNA repair exonuclease SbcCD nuclease subunit